MTLQKKLLLVTAVPLIVVFIAIIILTEVIVKNSLQQDAFSYTNLVAQESGGEIEAVLNATLIPVEALAEDLISLYKNNLLTRNLANNLLKGNLTRSKLFGLGLFMEDNVLGMDADYAGAPIFTDTGRFTFDDTGRFNIYFYQDGAQINVDHMDNMDQDGDLWYGWPKKTLKGVITEPYMGNVSGKDVMMVTASIPLVADGRFIGVLVADLALDSLVSDVAAIAPYGTGFAHLISNGGMIIATGFSKDTGAYITDVKFMNGELSQKVADLVRKGETDSFSWVDKLSGKKTYSVVTPVRMSNFEQSWGIMISVHLDSAFAAVGLPEMRLISRSVLAFIIIIIFAAAYYMRRFIICYLNQFVAAFRDVTEGEGDLTKMLEIRTGDEFEVLANYLNKFLNSMRMIILNLKKTSDSSIQSSHELSSAAEELEATFSSQSVELTAVASAMEEMSASAGEVNLIIVGNNTIVQDSGEKIKEGQKRLKETLDSINIIKAKTVSLADTVNGFGDSSDKIGMILNVINDIADQTNLLALNAAIEAARAGDAGRGFAVVADEVRKLAERTQKATSEINAIISDLQSGARKASEEMGEAGQSVEQGVDRTVAASTVFEEIVKSVETIQNNSSQIGQAVEQQVAAVHGVNNSTRAISDSVKESNLAVSAFRDAVVRIATEATQTGDLLKKFKVE